MSITTVINSPAQPWAIVCCHLNGTNPDPAVPAQLRELIVTNPASLASFWRDQSLGLIDLSRSVVYGWYPCGWNVRSTDGPFNMFPGITSNLSRTAAIAQARQVLRENVGEVLWQYRGIIAVFNFSVNGGRAGYDIAYGLNGLMSDVEWAESGWHICKNCLSPITPSGAGRPCTHPSDDTGLFTSPVLGDSRYAVPHDATVVGTRAGIVACAKCGCLYDATASSTGATCEGGAQHAPAATTRYFPLQWKDPLGAAGRKLYVCTGCHVITGSPNPNAKPSLCPNTGKQHALSTTELSIVPISRDPYNRTFLAHEMGHAYGFNHGLGWQVQSTDSGDDCLPGAYGDGWDIMSAMNCDYYAPAPIDVDGALGVAGPGLALHHLVTANAVDAATIAIAPITAYGGVYTIRPVNRPDLPGVAGIRAGRCLIELRHRDGWDRALKDSVGQPAPQVGITVYDMSPVLPTRLLMPNGQSFLAEGDRFKNRSGLGDVSVEVETMSANPPSATLRVTNTGEQIINNFQRWLVLRCKYPDGADPSTLPDPIALLEGGSDPAPNRGVAAFWTEAAAGAFFVAGGGGEGVDAVNANTSDHWIPFPVPSVNDQADTFPARVDAMMLATLGITTQKDNKALPMYLDFRNFTGILIVRNVPLRAVTVGRRVLRSGNALPDFIDCPSETREGVAAGNLTYDVIEIGSNHLSHATMAAAIGQSLGLAHLSNDHYDVMGGGAYRTTLPDIPSYGEVGPRPSTDSLVALKWLPASRIAAVDFLTGQDTTSGTIVIAALSDLATTDLPVRAEIGPYSFELRASADTWDRGLPNDFAVLARSDGVVTVLTEPLASVSWGAPPAFWTLLGGWVIELVAIDKVRATAILRYAAHRGRRFVAGGLEGEGTLWTYFEGHMVRVPLGDPYGGELVSAIERLAALAQRHFQRGPALRGSESIAVSPHAIAKAFGVEPKEQ